MRALFIHSTGTGPFMWDAISTDLVPERVRWSPPNLGYPPLPPLARGQQVSVDDDVRHLIANLPESADPIEVVAHSYGGLVALKAARRLGPRVRSLFLLEPVMFGALARDPATPPAARAETDTFEHHPWLLTDEARGGTDAWLELFIDYWNRPGSWRRLPESVRAHNLAMGWKMFQEVRAVALDAEDFSAFGFPNLPITLARGERTTAAARAMVDALAKVNPHAAVVELAGANHMAPLTHPSKVSDALADHLARLG